MYSLRDAVLIRSTAMLTMLVALAAALVLTGCRGKAGVGAGFAVRDASDCLPAITLLDAHGQKVSLAALKGRPVLFDFIYTSCPGECLLLTERMGQIANHLGPALGNEVRLVSITVDPEHDRPPQLLNYANSQAADVRGWMFLTGTPKQIDDVMARFNLVRKHEADGTVDHVPEFFLVDAKGRALLQYVGERADPERVASDLQQAAAGKPVTTNDGANVAVTY